MVLTYEQNLVPKEVSVYGNYKKILNVIMFAFNKYIYIIQTFIHKFVLLFSKNYMRHCIFIKSKFKMPQHAFTMFYDVVSLSLRPSMRICCCHHCCYCCCCWHFLLMLLLMFWEWTRVFMDQKILLNLHNHQSWSERE